MRIISQTRLVDVNYENYDLVIAPDGVQNITYGIFATRGPEHFSSNKIRLGIFETRERAMDIHNMFLEAFNRGAKIVFVPEK